MSSLSGNNVETPKSRAVSNAYQPAANVAHIDDDADETFAERLWGLTEMFPDSLKLFADKLTAFTTSTVKILCTFLSNASWIFCTSSILLFATVKSDRAQMEDTQKSEKNQQLLVAVDTSITATE